MEKSALLGGISDPYVAFPSSTRYFSKIDKVEWVEWPAVEYPDIYSLVPKEALKAYKILMLLIKFYCPACTFWLTYMLCVRMYIYTF